MSSWFSSAIQRSGQSAKAVPMVPALFFGREQTAAFLHAVASARILALTTNAVWRDYRESGVLNFFYGLGWVITLGNKTGPGSAEVQTAKYDEVKKQISVLFPKLYKEFQMNAASGPQYLVPWLKRQETALADDLIYLRKIFLEVRKVNEEVDEMLRVAIFRFAEIKFAAEVMLNVMGLLGFGGAAGMCVRLAVGTGYPIFVSMINGWNQAGGAGMILSATLGALKTGLVSAGSDSYAMSAATGHFVTTPLQKAAVMAWRGGGQNRQMARCMNANAQLARAGINATATVLTGLSCYYAYQGCQQSADAFWATVNQ